MAALAMATYPRPRPNLKAAHPSVQIVDTMPFARVIRQDERTWTVQICFDPTTTGSNWEDVFSAKSGVVIQQPRVVTSPQKARSDALTCMRYASEFQSVFVPLIVHAADLYRRSSRTPSFEDVAAFLLDARKQLFDLERRVSENWGKRKAYLPFGYVKAAEHWSALVTVICQRSTKMEA